MLWTDVHERLSQVVAAGLVSASQLYEREPDGRLVYRGLRPGPEWEGHGTFRRVLFTLEAGQAKRIVVHKQRWRLIGTNQTCHSRPPDDVASVWFCSLVVVTALWGWLSSETGLHRHEPLLPALSESPSPRTVQRWLARALAHADETALALRRAVIERCGQRSAASPCAPGPQAWARASP